ncbi:MAG: hypothetical protein V7641_710 [Blastocatellia bacterium]
MMYDISIRYGSDVFLVDKTSMRFLHFAIRNKYEPAILSNE